MNERRLAEAGRYGLLLSALLFFALPLYVVLLTSLKDMAEIRAGHLLAWPVAPTLAAWREAWSSACTGTACAGLRGGFLNSVLIAIPGTLLPVVLGALNGYALSFWRPRGAEWLYAILLAGAFIPGQVLIYPLVRVVSALGLYSTLPGVILVHTVFGLPVMTLLFRNYFALLPRELFQAARVDGAGFLRILWSVLGPLALPMFAVAALLQFTGVWNDYLLGLVFAGREHLPMTVQLNNIVNTTTGTRLYNLNMAATLLTAFVPLLLYFLAGRWFVRGITAGAVKG